MTTAAASDPHVEQAAADAESLRRGWIAAFSIWDAAAPAHDGGALAARLAFWRGMRSKRSSFIPR